MLEPLGGRERQAHQRDGEEDQAADRLCRRIVERGPKHERRGGTDRNNVMPQRRRTPSKVPMTRAPPRRSEDKLIGNSTVSVGATGGVRSSIHATAVTKPTTPRTTGIGGERRCPSGGTVPSCRPRSS
jgi:hypothetical protein